MGRMVLGSMCFGVSMCLGWSGIRIAACNTDTNPTQPQHQPVTQIALQTNQTETPTPIEQRKI